jgi:hypothetical protein
MISLMVWSIILVVVASRKQMFPLKYKKYSTSIIKLSFHLLQSSNTKKQKLWIFSDIEFVCKALQSMLLLSSDFSQYEHVFYLVAILLKLAIESEQKKLLYIMFNKIYVLF